MTYNSGSDQSDILIKPSANCRVAYTINNRQPVLCTLIGDQPLFYLEYMDSFEDDDFLLMDEGQLSDFQDELQRLEERFVSYERIAARFIEEPASRMDVIRAEADEVCRARDSAPCRDAGALCARIAKSRSGSALLERASEYGTEILLSDHVPCAYYDRESNAVLVRAGLEESLQILLLARELRRAWHHRSGVMVHPLAFHPDQSILINRALVADLAVLPVRVAWELLLGGDESCWSRIENSPLSDLGSAFAREACVDFRTLNTGQANAAAFETWFLSERCRRYDRAVIQEMLADNMGYVFGGDAETSRLVTIEILRGIGEMPHGKNYLSAHVHNIAADPIFTDVRDRSNANFLWFIKFEKTFRDAEETLADRNADLRGRADGAGPGGRACAEVISLADAASGTRESAPKAGPEAPFSSAEIVILEPWLRGGGF